MNDDPPRLLEEGSGASEPLGRLFRQGRSDLPDRVQIERLGARLGPLLGAAPLTAEPAPQPAPPAAPPPAEAASTVAKTGALTKALAAGGIALVVGGAGWLLVRGDAPRNQPPEVASPVASAPIAEAPAAAPAHEVARAAPAPSTESAPPAAEPSKPRAEPPARGPSEAELLRQAQASVKKDPKRALALIQEHKRRFPNGALSQEREVIAIDALQQLGEHEQVKKRARDFEKRYPDSAHRRKVGAAAEEP
jgi:hypothetical protein